MPVGFQHVRSFGYRHDYQAYQQGYHGPENCKDYSFSNEIVRSHGGVPHQNGEKHDGGSGNAGYKKIVKLHESSAPQGKSRKDNQKGHKSGIGGNKETYKAGYHNPV